MGILVAELPGTLATVVTVVLGFLAILDIAAYRDIRDTAVSLGTQDTLAPLGILVQVARLVTLELRVIPVLVCQGTVVILDLVFLGTLVIRVRQVPPSQ